MQIIIEHCGNRGGLLGFYQQFGMPPAAAYVREFVISAGARGGILHEA